MGRTAVTLSGDPGPEEAGGKAPAHVPGDVHQDAASRPLLSRVMSAGATVAGAWNRFWYSPSDPTVLCLLRWLAGGMLLYTHIVWGLNLSAFFGSAGWHSPELLKVVQEGSLMPSFLSYVPDRYLLAVHSVCLVILAMFWIGLATRVTSVLSLVITISYCHRALLANFGLDQLNAILCLYLCIGPSGAMLSADRLLSVWRATRRAASQGAAFVAPPIPSSSASNLAIRLIQIHFCVIYTFAGLSKLQGPAWWNGEAVWLAFANLEYQSFDMTWIAWYPWIGELLTHGTIVWEVSFAALVWVRPVRPIVLLIGFLLHIGIGGMMGMWTFGLIMIFGHIAFWPKHWVSRLVERLPTSEQLLGLVAPPAASVPAPFEPGGSPLPASKFAPAVLSIELLADDAEQDSAADEVVFQPEHAPTLIYVDGQRSRRLACLQYFLDHGFKCLSSERSREARLLCEASEPDAVIIMGRDLPDSSIAKLPYRLNLEAGHRPIFLVLTNQQSRRLNGQVHVPGCHVLTGDVSLGRLRREIQAVLATSQKQAMLLPSAGHS
ncbi:MAG: HTTM domain-containing protein [Planctomycetaceae bacterium]